ncbi:MAG: dihydrodipicolinate synthase family protein [Acidimicrobiia bacterium]
MPRITSNEEFDSFDEWETLDMDDEIYLGAESDLLDDWEDDGAIAQVREENPVIKSAAVEEEPAHINDLTPQDESGQVFSLLERANSKRKDVLDDIEEPSLEELNEIELQDFDIDEVEDEAEAEAEISVVNEPEIEENIMEYEDTQLVLKPLFEGLGVMLPTLFDEDGEVEYKTTSRLAKKLIESQTSSIFVGTNFGEGQTLSREERASLVENVCSQVKANVVADVTAPSIRQSVELFEDVVRAGANAVIVDLNQNVKDPYALCESLHSKNPTIPIFINLIAPADQLVISPEFLYDLPICGVLDSTGDPGFFLHLTGAYSGPIYIANPNMVTYGKIMGASGVVLPNIAIQEKLVYEAFNGDPSAQNEIAMYEREIGGITPKSIKMTLESENLVSATVRD